MWLLVEPLLFNDQQYSQRSNYSVVFKRQFCVQDQKTSCKQLFCTLFLLTHTQRCPPRWLTSVDFLLTHNPSMTVSSTECLCIVHHMLGVNSVLIYSYTDHLKGNFASKKGRLKFSIQLAKGSFPISNALQLIGNHLPCIPQSVHIDQLTFFISLEMELCVYKTLPLIVVHHNIRISIYQTQQLMLS